MLDIREFIEEMKSEVMSRLPDDVTGDILVDDVEVVKMNDQKLHGLTFKMPGVDAAPTLYVDEMYEAYKDGAFATTIFTQTQSSEGNTFTINPREGSYEGMPQERAWQVIFFMMEEPNSVRINGEATDSWTYDDVLKRLIVNIPTRPCSETIVVNVKEKETGIAEAVNSKSTSGKCFDLDGRQVFLSQRSMRDGIYIHNGKKTYRPIP